jgi:hypothetical protein
MQTVSRAARPAPADGPTFEDLVLWLEEVFDDCPEPLDRSWLALYVAHKLCGVNYSVAEKVKEFIDLGSE